LGVAVGKSHHRKSYRRKDGTFVRGATVRGKNPAPGCQWWLIGMVALSAAVVSWRRGAGGRRVSP
jgi:hypothetical protein